MYVKIQYLKKMKKKRNLLKIREMRKKIEFRMNEKQMLLARIRNLRKDRVFKTKERLGLSVRIKNYRKSIEFKKNEINKESHRKQKMRLENKARRQRERKLDRERKKVIRENEVFRFREQFADKVRIENNDAKKDFLDSRLLRPEFICCCCAGLFFRHSVIKFEEYKYSNSEVLEKIKNYVETIYICRTCDTNSRKSKIPMLALSNGLEFPEVPECIKILSPLIEERMIAPYINFMQIKAKMSHAINPQLGLKGSVVNIPVEINDMINVLPRSFDNMQTIQIKLKRYIEHSTDYMYETIRPAAAVVCKYSYK